MKKFIFIFILLIIFGGSVSASSIDSKFNANGGPSIISDVSVIESTTDSGGFMRFGTNFSGTYSYQASDLKVLTNGANTVLNKNSVVDGQLLATDYDVKTTGGLNAFITTATASDQSNIPDTSCDSSGFLSAGETTSSRYPSHQVAVGTYGAMGSGTDKTYALLKTSTTVGDNLMAASNEFALPSGIYYDNTRASAMVGFDKNTTVANYKVDSNIHHMIAANDTNTGTYGTAEIVVEDATTVTDDSTINENLVVANATTYEGMSIERLNEYVNETTNGSTTEETPEEMSEEATNSTAEE